MLKKDCALKEQAQRARAASVLERISMSRPVMSTSNPLKIHAQRLIVATNRGPVEHFLTKDQTLKSRRGSGGVITALIDAGNQMDMTWVAMAMTDGDRIAAKNVHPQKECTCPPIAGQKMHLRYVTVSKAAYGKHYEKISNQLLWFLQHYMYNPSEDKKVLKRLQDAWENGYRVANRAIAEAVIAEIESDETKPVVMLHDYHLYLASRMVRQKHPTIVMQQFIHIPWPDVRCWHFLPGNIAQEIYQGLVGNDLLGFQTERDARNFLDGARTMLDGAVVDFEESAVWWQGHRTRARAYPISISVTTERKAISSAASKRVAEQIKEDLAEFNIMRVDRIEPTKNILRGFQAYAQLLEEHPEFRGRVTFLAFLVPSRQSLPEYKRYTADVKKLIDEVNERYGTDTWQPIKPFYGNDRTRALVAMQYYDVLMVNPIIDGMNLVAKEGAVVNQNDGLLLLSRTIGAFQELGKACVPTSPTDIKETSEALYKALTCPPEERRKKSGLARLIVERRNLDGWLQRQVDDLNELLDRQVIQPETPEIPAISDLDVNPV
jgi:trehalose 6-phosphate synthase